MTRRHDCLVVIPARMGSTRFPGKVLAPLNGKPIVEWCRQAALKANVGPVVVATETAEVATALKPLGAEVILTSEKCASGSDRVWEAARKKMTKSIRFVINLQGDEPLIQAGTIRAVAETLRRRRDADIATAVVPMHDRQAADNPNVVKAILASDGRCLYFSRSPAPYLKPGAAGKVVHPARSAERISPLGAENGLPSFWKHIGIYGYRRNALKRFVTMKPSPLEKRESLEQLRALEDGMSIFAAVVKDHTVAIDTPEDLAQAESAVRTGKSPESGSDIRSA